MHDTLRLLLCEALGKAKNNGVIESDNIEELSEKIYIILEGTYYYLGMVDDEVESENKMRMVKEQIVGMLKLNIEKPKASADLEYISE